MDSLAYNYKMEDAKTLFSTASEVNLTTTTDSAAGSLGGLPASSEPSFTAHAPVFHGQTASDLINMFAQQEPHAADVAPTSDLDDMTMNFGRMGNSEIDFDDHNYLNYLRQGNRAESVTSSRNNVWNESASPHPNDQMSTFDFLVKSVSAANNYVSMLTREQLHVLQSLRPSLLFEFLQEVARVRTDKRMRRALPNECAFCKNNGENEECYSKHALKDWRGRVLCPVLRAFRCPRCGATGDRAHTIKYCPENSDAERSVTLGGRRRAPASASFPLSSAASGISSGVRSAISSGISSMPQTPTHSGPPSLPSSFNSGLWSFGLN